jgi:hypothetical protein
MAKQPQGATVEVEVYLNERWVPLRGWSSGHLLEFERKMFTHAFGSPPCGYRGERHGTPAEDALQLPTGWEWTSEWQQQQPLAGSDADGFEYAGQDWTKFEPDMFTTACVRRRRLVRRATKVLPKPEPAYPFTLLASGYFTKQGGFVKNWKQRWFEIRAVVRPDPEAWAKNQSLEHAELKYYDIDGHGAPGEEKAIILLGRMKTTSDDKAMTIELSGTSPDGEAFQRSCAFNSRADYDDFLQVLEPELTTCSAKIEEVVGESQRPRRGALAVVSVAHGDLAKDTTSHNRSM